MRTLNTFVFAAGLIGLAVIGFANDGMAASAHGQNGSTKIAGAANKSFPLPLVNPSRGRKLFASKGCVVCHAINGIGGKDAPSLVVKGMPSVMNPFEFAARMWRGAETMIAMQQDELGKQIEFTGDELADIIAFVHSFDEQKKFSKADIPANISDLMGHLKNGDAEHKGEEWEREPG